MKKIALFGIAALCSGASLATSNYTSSSGIVVIPDVNVNGTALYDSVTLRLDSNGTYSVLNVQPKNKTISDTPLDTLTTEGFTVSFLGCGTTGTNEITCYLRVVNNELDRPVYIHGYYNSTFQSILYDDLNNSYAASSVTFTNKTDSSQVGATLIQGVPANASILFKNINIRAKSISAFKPSFDYSNNKQFVGNFKNIKF
ncbi:MAG: hypothetical protein HOP02_09355 [Methylococcaceae bacterium]|nr:hypothetical protein [Methylococcaceae bacterium]